MLLRILIIVFCVLGAYWEINSSPSYAGLSSVSEIDLPKDFWWGTSLAAHQSEGGNNNSWTRWESVPGHIKNNETAGRAADEWNLFEADYDKLVWLNANTHRLSVEWSRLEPKPGQWDEEAFAHYRKMILALKARHIRPIICLFHFTLPLWVADQGGFENLKTIEDFVVFSKKVRDELGGEVHDWLTLNEPVVYAVAGYGAGVTPPGVKDLARVAHVVANLMRAHGRVYKILKASDAQAEVSLAHHLRVFEPRNWFNPLDYFAAKVVNNFFNWAWFDAIQTGRIKLWVPLQVTVDEPCEECRGALDYIGFNYYSRDYVAFSLTDPNHLQMISPLGGTKTDMGWDIYPQGIKSLLLGIKDHGLEKYPLVLTENGLADASDSKRPQFIYDHLKIFLETSNQLNLKAKGYLYWSLIDNFEWIDGFEPRFGLFAVDYKTMERKPRPSANYFRLIGQTHKLTAPVAL